mmetsp:Transcript_7686/g.12207  ORF Transcript_7686/g.12207 Transcript_7686/m.12207 type:complete len:116 (+) Transcript_7686:379-726(+)
MLAGTAHRKLLWEILVILAVNHVIVAVIGYVAGAATPGLSLSQQKPKIVKYPDAHGVGSQGSFDSKAAIADMLQGLKHKTQDEKLNDYREALANMHETQRYNNPKPLPSQVSRES